MITLEQVLPSLPPPEHGGSIDTLAWVSVQTKDFLFHHEKCLKEVIVSWEASDPRGGSM